MKKYFTALLGGLLVCGCLFAGCNGSKKDYGTLNIRDIENLLIGGTQTIEASFSKQEYASEITYSFTGNAITIANGAVTANERGRSVTVKAKTQYHETSFKVTTGLTYADYGTLNIADIELEEEDSAEIEAVFSLPARREEVRYTFSGDAIKIENGVVTALSKGQSVTVTAKTAHHETTFVVRTVRSTKPLKRTVYAWTGYPASTLPDLFAGDGEVTYGGYESDELVIDGEKLTVQGLKAGTYNVTATADKYGAEYTVVVKDVDKSGAQWQLAADYTAYSGALKARWQTDGRAGRTTLFIGDSFFDTRYFWTDFYTNVYAGKDAICAGISSTTSYDWEQLAESFLRETAPKNLVMHMGTNNLYDDNDTAAQAAESLQRMFTVIHSVLPDTKIYYFAISVRAYDEARQQRTREVNDMMQAWCRDRAFITFLDTEEQLTSDMLKDGTHPALQYYSVFTDALKNSDIAIENK